MAGVRRGDKVKAIAAACGCSEQTCYNTINSLRDRGLLPAQVNGHD